MSPVQAPVARGANGHNIECTVLQYIIQSPPASQILRQPPPQTTPLAAADALAPHPAADSR